MTTYRNIDELELISLADGGEGISETRLSELDDMLRKDPEARHRLNQYRSQHEALQAAFTPKGLEPVPDRLLAALTPRRTVWNPSIDWTTGAGIAMAASVVLAVVFTLGQYRQDVPGRVIDAAVSEFRANPRTQLTPPLSLAGLQGSATEHTKQTPSWAPDMNVYGYRFDGARVLRLEGREMMRVDYGASAGGSVTLFLARTRDEETARVEVRGDGAVNWAHWKRRPLDVVVVTRESKDVAASFARLVRERLDKGPTPGHYAGTLAPPENGGASGLTPTPAAAGNPLKRTILPLCDGMRAAPGRECINSTGSPHGADGPPIIR